jgi:orotidine-5'-phosphate decarboxylase
MTTTTLDKLRAVQEQHHSWLCVGLDPVPERLPAGVDVLAFGQAIVDATAELVCAYKLNLAFYLAFGPAGVQALQDTVAHIPDHIPVILDAKFGDIHYTASQSARFAFDHLGVDAVTTSVYVGMDAVLSFLEYPGKLAFVLVRSANTTSNDFQLWPAPRSPLFRFVTAQLNTLYERCPGQVGISAAATHARDFGRIRAWAPSLPFLIPGIGAQGGDLAPAVEHGPSRTGTGPVISISRAIIYASDGSDFAPAAEQAARTWAARIREQAQSSPD